MRREVIITIKNRDKADEVFNVTDDFYVENENDLNRHMNEIAGHIAYYGQLRADAEQYLKAVEDEYKVWFAQAKDAEMQKKTFKSETAKEEAVIVSDPKIFLEKRAIVQDAQYKASILKVVCDAMEAKKDMLISIGAQIRQSMGGGLCTKRISDLNSKLESTL